MTIPLLRAATPAAWLATYGAADAGVVEPTGHRDEPAPAWLRAVDLLDGEASGLRDVHARLCADRVPPAAAAKWVVSWFAGGLAEVVGFMLAMAAAAPLVERGRTRWRLHPDGWPDLVDPGPVPVVVPAGHPWAGQPGTLTVHDERAVAAVAVPALVTVVDEFVEAGHRMAKVGRTSLWAEVADGVGLPLLHRSDLPADPAAVARLRLALAVPGVPWRRRPDLRLAAAGDQPVYLGRKAGCCLTHRCPPDPEPDPDTLDERERAYRERFPTDPDQPRYCSTCSLRTLADCEDRQRYWLAQERAATGPR